MKKVTLNDAQKTHMLCGFLDVHRRMEELEAYMADTMPSPFSGRAYDLSPAEVKVVRDEFERVRAAMLEQLRELDIPLEVRQNSLRWVVQENIIHIEITLDDLGPKSLTGYGSVDEETRAAVATIQDDLERLFDRAKTYLRQELGPDLSERPARADSEPSRLRP